MSYNFLVQSNDIVCRKKGRLGLDLVIQKIFPWSVFLLSCHLKFPTVIIIEPTVQFPPANILDENFLIHLLIQLHNWYHLQQHVGKYGVLTLCAWNDDIDLQL